MSCIYTYKNKEYTKDEFYKFVGDNLVEKKTVPKYTKILFPTGNTASLIEGHTTLEEFKKQKEDRIKELEKENQGYSKEIEDLKFEREQLFLNAYKEAPSTYEIDRKIEQTQKQIEERNNKEINQLKQELERVEGPEGFDALKPIYNFYENTVANILNKTYGKENVKLITDEHGNTWNEVTIEKERDRSDILLQVADKSNKDSIFTDVKDLSEKYFNGNTTGKSYDVVKRIANSKHPLNKLADKLLPYVKENNININLVDYIEKTEKGITPAGIYNSISNDIKIATNVVHRGRGVENTILHEVLHSITFHELRNNTTAQKDLIKLLKHTRKFLPSYNPLTREGTYATYTLDEFLVGLFTDPEFILQLNKIPSVTLEGTYDNIFEELLDYILGLFNIRRGNNVYNDAVVIASKILEDFNESSKNSKLYQEYQDSLASPALSRIQAVEKELKEEYSKQTEKEFQQSLNKPDTNPVLQGNQQEQTKKFAELQERLNNKEFLEGAKNAFESSEELQNVYYEAVGFNRSNTIEGKLKTFFTGFGFHFKEGDSSTDLLNKIIYTSSKDSSVFINNSTKALSQLLLANTNIDFHRLETLIEDTPEFKKVLSDSSQYLKDTHKFLKDGNRIPMEEWVSYIKDYNKIKNEVLEKYIKESLLDNNNSTRLHKLINDFLKWFKDLFVNAKNLKEVTDSLIQQVLLNQRDVIVNSKDLQNKERVTLAKALEETTHGRDIIKTFGDFGLILTGSVSAAEQGSVFRKTGKLLHDIDWVVPKGFTKDFNNKLKDTFPGVVLVREFDSPSYYTQTYIVPPKGYTVSNLAFFKPETYGERKYIASYDVLDKNGNTVSNYRRYYDVKESGKVVENREVYNEGIKSVDKNLEAVSVDFFQNKEDLKYKPYTVNVEGVNLQLSNWLSSFTEKLKYGRVKDLLDYANFIPNDLVLQTSQTTPQQKQDALNAYTDYIAKVSLGIIKNPTSGEYNYESQVNDIVSHNSPNKFEKFNVNRGRLGIGVYFGLGYKIYNTGQYNYNVLLNITSLKRYDKGEFVSTANKLYPSNDEYSTKPQDTLRAVDEDGGVNGYVSTSPVGTEFLVFEPEQIHVLASKFDIKGFKDFMAFEIEGFKEFVKESSQEKNLLTNEYIENNIEVLSDFTNFNKSCI